MFQLLIGGAILATGAYLLNEAQESNRSARRGYNRQRKESEAKIRANYLHAKRKDTLDKLFKVKRAKQKITDTIYRELKSYRKNLKKMNYQLKESKELLDNLFGQKKSITIKEEKITIQQNINIVVEGRRELFAIRDRLKESINTLESKLKSSNIETRLVQKEINRVLSDNIELI